MRHRGCGDPRRRRHRLLRGRINADDRPAERAAIDPAFAEGTSVGQRYVDAGGTIELLWVKPGAGSLALDGVSLTTKDAKPLPASD